MSIPDLEAMKWLALFLYAVAAGLGWDLGHAIVAKLLP